MVTEVNSTILMSKIFYHIPDLSFLSKEFSSSYSVALIIFITVFYNNIEINTLCSDELMVIRLRMRLLGEKKILI